MTHERRTMRHTDSWRDSKRRFVVTMVLASLVLAALLCANLCIGSVGMSPAELLGALAAGPGANGLEASVIWQIRLPRAVSAAILGGALACSGFLLQTFFNNPIASPYILGISAGAKCALAAVTICVIGAGGALASWQVVGAAFVGSLAATALVLGLSTKIRSMSMLIVAGVMAGYVFNAITDFLVTFASDQNIVNLHNWSLGSFSGSSWDDVAVIAVVVITVSACVFAISKPLSAFQLGEAYAKSVGVNVARFRVVLVLLASMLSACVTVFAGPVSFVGIAVPHLVKSALKSSKPIRVIPACFLGGAIFCAGCDLIARTLFSPVELSISAVTAIFGAPVVIALMLKKRVR